MKNAPGVAEIVTHLYQAFHSFQTEKCFGRRLRRFHRRRTRKEEAYATLHCPLLIAYAESLHWEANLSKNRATACCCSKLVEKNTTVQICEGVLGMTLSMDISCCWRERVEKPSQKMLTGSNKGSHRFVHVTSTGNCWFICVVTS